MLEQLTTYLNYTPDIANTISQSPAACAALLCASLLKFLG